MNEDMGQVEHPFLTLCRKYNRIADAPPGINLPEACAMAMSDFLEPFNQELERRCELQTGDEP